MSITDELRRMLDQSKRGLDMESLERLRRYVNEHTNTDWEYATFPPQRQLVNCTDTAVYALIDAIENEVVSMRNLAWNEGYDMGFTSADKLAADREDKLAEHGWVRLPKDADGEYIHIGDKVTCGASVWEVTGFRFTGGLWGICCTVFNDQGGSGTNVYPPSDLHHYHAPTVEDMLREFAAEFVGMANHVDDHEVTDAIEMYAAKLRLAGDAE